MAAPPEVTFALEEAPEDDPAEASAPAPTLTCAST